MAELLYGPSHLRITMPHDVDPSAKTVIEELRHVVELELKELYRCLNTDRLSSGSGDAVAQAVGSGSSAAPTTGDIEAIVENLTSNSDNADTVDGEHADFFRRYAYMVG